MTRELLLFALLSAPLWPQAAAPQTSYRITPVRPVDELRKEALSARLPVEDGDFLPSDLVEVARYDSGIRFDVRYATSNNFLGTPLYTASQVFLQRPVEEAIVRVDRKLRAQGFGLLIFDGYRPWYVTKIFWEATPADKRDFVANPAMGSRHNRGCAADLSLFDLRTGKPADMPSGYDEMSERASPDYTGGTPEQRRLRDLLRSVMESEGFAVFPSEWWHFDYKDWRRYRINNTPIEDLVRKRR
jgi:D-alanyl-D-alanine dipeptidase